MEVMKVRRSDWRKHLDLAARHSGGIKGYCRESGIKNSRFHYWKKKLAIKSVSPITSKAFTAVEVVNERRAAAMPDPKWLAEFLLSLSGGAK